MPESALTPEVLFRTVDAAHFRRMVLRGCCVLDEEELRVLADALHDRARELHARRPGVREYARRRYPTASQGRRWDQRI